MKLFTPEKTELIDVTKVSSSTDGVVIEGTIMGALPMRAVLTPAELRKAFSLLTFRTMLTLVAMLFRTGQ
jgi:hypothetical protein